jgi:DNA-binding CsgD family transcriptional regulator
LRSRLRRVSEAQWQRRVVELATFLAEQALARDVFERFLGMLADDMPASSAVMDYDAHERRTEFVTWRVDSSAMRAYSEHYHAINPFAHAILNDRLYNGTFIGSRWVDPRGLLRTEYYDGFMRPRGEQYFIALSIAFPDGGRTGVPFYRGEAEGGDFTHEEARRLDMLRPFLRNVLLLRHLHRRYSLDGLPIISSHGANVEPCNDAAESMLQDNRFSEKSPRLPFERSGVEVVVPPPPVDPAAVFQRRYGLTHRESEIAALLCDGLTYHEVASRLAISPHTVNGHVKSFLRKLNLNSIRRLPSLLRVTP